MNSQLNGDVFRELLRLLEALRVCTDRDARVIRLGRCWGFNSALRCAGLISFEEQFRLDALATSAGDYSGQVFPGGIVGPVMPTRVWLERNRVSNAEINDAAVKLLARVPADEHPCEVPAPASRPELRVLCLLVKDRDGKSRSLPVHTMRPVPPCVLPAGRWSLASDPTFELRETHATRPAPEVLERCARHWPAHALRPDSRTVRAGGVMV